METNDCHNSSLEAPVRMTTAEKKKKNNKKSKYRVRTMATIFATSRNIIGVIKNIFPREKVTNFF